MGNAEVRQTVIGSGNIFTATGDVRITYQLPPAEADERRVLLQLTGSVKQFWIAGVLERSVHEAAMIELRKEARPDAVQHPWERVLELPGQPARSLGGERKIGEVFVETGRALLVLGEPGAGKTVTLLELARDLIERFEKDPAQSAPVILNLSTWEKKRGALSAWIEAELKSKYFVPPRRTRAWLASSRLTLLLDGLDEVAPESQAACIQAINRFLQTNGAPGIAVCCRLAEYLALPDRLCFTGAVCLQPLTPDQVDEFLARGGSQLAVLRTALQNDTLLQELARTPLLLNVLSLAYRDVPVEVIAVQQGNTIESRRRHLFDSYVQRMFRRVANAPAMFSEASTRTWLSWLAGRMRDHSITVFSLDQLQPGWLPSVRDGWRYAFASRITSALVWTFFAWTASALISPAWRSLFVRGTPFAILAVIVAGSIAGLVDGHRLTAEPRTQARWRERLRVVALVSVHIIALTLAFGVMSALFYEPIHPIFLPQIIIPLSFFGWQADALNGFRSGLFFGIVFALRGARSSPTHDIRLADVVRLSWASARKAAKVGGIAGTIFGVVLVAALIAAEWQKFEQNPPIVIVLGAAVGAVVVGLFFALVAASVGMFARSDLPGNVKPGQWLRRSMQNAALAGLVTTLASSIILVPGVFLPGSPWPLAQTLVNCCVLGIAAGMWYGGFDALHHLALRYILCRRGVIPKRYAEFLDYSARLIFLQKVGSGYLFMHRQLLEYFADQANVHEEKPAVRVHSRAP